MEPNKNPTVWQKERCSKNQAGPQGWGFLFEPTFWQNEEVGGRLGLVSFGELGGLDDDVLVFGCVCSILFKLFGVRVGDVLCFFVCVLLIQDCLGLT